MNELEKKAREFLKQEEYLKAAKLYLELAVQEKDNENMLISAANCYDKLDEKKLSLELYKKALKINPNSLTALTNIAISYYERKKYDKAILYSKQVLMQDENNFTCLLNLGNTYFANGDYKQALEYYQHLYEINSNSYLAIVNIANTCFNLTQFAQSLKFALIAQEKRPTCVEPYIIAGNSYIELGNKEEAIKMLKQASRIAPPSGWLCNSISNLFRKMGEWEQCLHYAFKALRIKDNALNNNDHINFGYLLYEAYDEGKTEVTEKYLSRWEELSPDNPIIHHMSCAIRNIQEIKSMDTEYIKGIFDSFASSFDSILQDLEYQAPTLIAQTIKENFKSKLFKKRKILDIGCGTGLCAEAIKQYYPNEEYYGVDISEKMLEKAGIKNIYKELYADDILNFLENNQTQYELVTACDVLTYMGDIKTLVRLLSKSIKINGLLCFSITKNIFNQKDYFLTPSGRFVHAMTYICRLLHFCGFKIISSKECILRHEGSKEVIGNIILARRDVEVLFE